MGEKKFKTYVGDPDFHDGAIDIVRRELDELSVEVEGYSGARYLVRFTGVEFVVSNHPEGMVLSALAEMEAQPPLRWFCFANSKEPDEEGGDSALEVTARGYSVQKI